MENFIFSFNAVFPLFFMVLVGYLLNKKGFINASFSKTANDMVFKFAIPALLFVEISNRNIKDVFDLKLCLFALCSTLCIYIITWLTASFFIKSKADLGAFVQGAIRGNYALIGVPLTIRLFSEAASAKSAVLLAVIVPTYNLLAVIVLTVCKEEHERINFKEIFLNILKNPLIISTMLGLVFSMLNIRLPAFAIGSLRYMADLAIPLALLTIGGGFNFVGLKETGILVMVVCFLKLILFPVILLYIAYAIGFDGVQMGILFILLASPTAVSSYPMARAMNSNSILAGNIVLATTIVSAFTIYIGVTIMKFLQIF